MRRREFSVGMVVLGMGRDLGLRRLQAYRKEWDEGRGVWKDRPRHDEASHGADAFLTFTYTKSH
jgi:hypothetical protein